jgi:uncharacterized protein GlcG (DUF336 family)
VRIARTRWLVAPTALVASAGLVVGTQNTPTDRIGGTAAILNSDDVLAILSTAATALGNDTMAVAVVDRTGAILGVYSRPGAAASTPDEAVTVARAGAMFANDQAPLSSRTVRFISGIHFPPGIRNTPNAALYGIENTNRGCQIDAAGDMAFNTPVARPATIAGTFAVLPDVTPLPCRPSDTRGCEPVGINTGKKDVFDSGQSDPTTVPVNPGGVPLYRGGKVIGGVGVTGVSPDLAEYAATLSAAGAGRNIDFSEPLPAPGAVFIDGVRLPFFGTCADIPCIRAALRTAPPGATTGQFGDGRLIVTPRNGSQAPEGYLIGPRASASGSLTLGDVQQIVNQSIAVALRTRAQIRLPPSQPTRMIVAVADESGQILAAYRMADATFFSLDVAMTKARNAYYFSTREGYEVLRGYVDAHTYDNYSWEPDPPAGQGWAMTARTLSFAGQPLFPPGIDLTAPPVPGPWFDLFRYDTANPCTEGSGPSRGANRTYLNQSGVIWFPGNAPLYKNGRLVGGLGVSGDGVDQDDYVSLGGSEGFTPPDALRVDNSVIRTGNGGVVRLPYLKLPRQPEI